MDGFHFYNTYLESHTTVRQGEVISLKKIKGAPETFDLKKLTENLARAASGDMCTWPEYKRSLHDPVENFYTVTESIILIEGNYLLLDRPGWCELKHYADYTIKMTADKKELHERLIARKMATGSSYTEASRHVDYSDMENVTACLEHSMYADMELNIHDIRD